LKFNCNSCGACCYLIGDYIKAAKYVVEKCQDVPEYVKEVSEFPHNIRSDGSCEHLQSDNTCAIYEDRPDICKVELTHKKYYSNEPIEEYYKKSEEACKKLESMANKRKA